MILWNMGDHFNQIGKQVLKEVGNETFCNPNNFFMIYNQKGATKYQQRTLLQLYTIHEPRIRVHFKFDRYVTKASMELMMQNWNVRFAQELLCGDVMVTALSCAIVAFSSLTFSCSDLTYSTVSSSMSEVLVVFSMLGTRSWSFFMRSLMRVRRTRSAMLRGWVAQPRFARARIWT